MNMPVVSSRLFMGILLVTALLALVIVTNGSAQAQTPSTETVMVSNAGRAHTLVATVSTNLWYAQSFCTGGTYTTLALYKNGILHRKSGSLTISEGLICAGHSPVSSNGPQQLDHGVWTAGMTTPGCLASPGLSKPRGM